MKNRAVKKYSQSEIENTKDIHTLIEMAYVIFQNYRPHKPLELYNRSWICENTVQTIYRTPVRELPAWVIYEYIDVSGSVDKIAVSDEMRYFIPRIFELLVQGQDICSVFSFSLQKCHLDLGVWSALELTVFKQFAKLFFKNQLYQYQDNFHYINVFGIIKMFYVSGLTEVTDELLEVLLKGLNNDVVLINFCANFCYACDLGSLGLISKIAKWIDCLHHKHIITQKILALTEKPIYQTLNDEYQYYIETVFDRLSK